MYEAYRVRRRFGWNGWQFSASGACECSKVLGSNQVLTRADEMGQPGRTGKFDLNPCQDLAICTGFTATACQCSDNGYCGMGSGGGACGIKSYTYGGDIWLVRELDARKEHILQRRFAIYDPTIPTGDELLKQEMYKTIALGEPNPDVILFKPGGERIESMNGNTQALDLTEVAKQAAAVGGN